jgi:hypothetical protein
MGQTHHYASGLLKIMTLQWNKWATFNIVMTSQFVWPREPYLLNNLHGYSVTQEIPSISQAWRFITILTWAQHKSLPCARWIESTFSHPISLSTFSIQLFRFHKRYGMSWVAKWLLASKDGLCSAYLVPVLICWVITYTDSHFPLHDFHLERQASQNDATKLVTQWYFCMNHLPVGHATAHVVKH